MANARAILLMTCAMAAFAATDALIKAAAETMGAMQVMLLISLFSLGVFLPLVWRSGARLISARVLDRAMLLRTCGEIFGSVGVVTSLAILPLSIVTALFQAQPLVLTAAAALFLSERVGWRRWAAVVAGFIGMLIILRPGSAAFDLAYLLPLMGVVGLTFRDLGSRLLPPDIGTPFASAWAFVCLMLVGGVGTVLSGGWRAMSAADWGLVACATVTISVAYAAITAALRTGEISAVAPFRYTRIVFAMAIAWVVFGERPDVAVWVGLALITFSGLYSFWRERALAARADVSV